MLIPVKNKIGDQTVENFYVLKICDTDKYLENVWEDGDPLYDEDGESDVNYSFTSRLSEAKRFYNYQVKGDVHAPKYLWDNIKGKHVETITEMCEMFNGEIIEVEKVTNWTIKE